MPAGPPGAAGPGAPFPQWTVTMTAATGYPVAQVTNATEKAIAEAVAFPTKLVFFTTAAAAAAYSKSLGGTGSTTPIAKVGGQAALNAGTQAAQDAAHLGWNLVIGNTSGLLVRILKVGVGLVLLVAGVLKLSGTDKKLATVLPIVGGPAGKVLAA